MPEERTTIADIRVLCRIKGELIAPDGSGYPAIVRIEHAKYDPEAIDCELYVEADREGMLKIFESAEDLRVRAISGHGPDLVLRGLLGREVPRGPSSRPVTMSIQGYEEVSPVRIPAGATAKLSCPLSGGRAAAGFEDRELSFTGEITVRHERAIRWERHGREYELRMASEFEDAEASGHGSTVVVARPTFYMEFVVEEESDSEELFRRSRKEMDDVLLLLAFMSREWVHCANQDLFLLGAPEKGRSTHLGEWKTVVRRAGRETTNELCPQGQLAKGVFAAAVEVLETSTIASEVRRAMTFAVASHSARGLESSFILAWAALETISGAVCSRDQTGPKVEPRQARAVLERLRAELKIAATDNGLDQATAEAIRDKLSEVLREPIVNLIEREVARLDVKTSDIWPVGTSVRDGLKQAHKLRNGLVHRAASSDLGSLWAARDRIRLLAERTVLRVLEVPDWALHSGHAKEAHRRLSNAGQP